MTTLSSSSKPKAEVANEEVGPFAMKHVAKVAPSFLSLRGVIVEVLDKMHRMIDTICAFFLDNNGDGSGGVASK